MKKLFILLPLSVLALAGCTTATLTTKEGVTLKYQNVFFQKQIGKFSMTTNGLVELEGVQSDAANLIKAISEGVSNGLIKTAAPVP